MSASEPPPKQSNVHEFPRKISSNDDPPSNTTVPTSIMSTVANYLHSSLDTLEGQVFLLSTIFKILLWPAYRSTDFEVHRNWLAVTHSLPISKWYYDTTSEWTLDYPPFFAYFEYILSIPASLMDGKIVDLQNLNYDAWTVVAYQRTTVMLTELVLGAALLKFIKHAADPNIQRILCLSLFTHPGFLIVDHIHFQYNGFMFGILLWSIFEAQQGNNLLSGALFAILLNFKHIYMYIAPAYFVYLLRAYCMTPRGTLKTLHFISLANVVIAVFVLSLGPFILMGQLGQLISRLFPFTRGLNHAYWAPNAWALITTLDRILLRYAKTFKLAVEQSGIGSTSRGLVGDTVFAVLPDVKPLYTFTITFAFQSIFLAKLWFVPTYKSFLVALTLCGYSSFMFGWHVHEKAVLLILVPLSLLAAENHAFFRTFLIASFAGIYGLFPLLFTPAETFIKIGYSALWAILFLPPISRKTYDIPSTLSLVILDRLELAYLLGFAPLQLAVTIINLQGKENLAFFPLLMTSVYCALGLTWAFIRLAYLYLSKF